MKRSRRDIRRIEGITRLRDTELDRVMKNEPDTLAALEQLKRYFKVENKVTNSLGERPCCRSCGDVLYWEIHIRDFELKCSYCVLTEAKTKNDFRIMIAKIIEILDSVWREYMVNKEYVDHLRGEGYDRISTSESEELQEPQGDKP